MALKSREKTINTVLGVSRKDEQWGSVLHNKFGSIEPIREKKYIGVISKSVPTWLHITFALQARRVNACFTKICRL